MERVARRETSHLFIGLPSEVTFKINKTKQTRGAQPYERVVYQNRVNRNGIVVIPYAFKDRLIEGGFENGHVFLVRPQDYFCEAGKVRADFDKQVVIGQNAFIYYDNRHNYSKFPPLNNWKARVRGGPGDVVYRLPATTAKDDKGKERVEGDPQGIRFFEYASSDELYKSCIQLALLSWHTVGINEVRTDGAKEGVPKVLLEEANRLNLWDVKKMTDLGVFCGGATICPLCRSPIKASELMNRVEQAEGREVYDLTITEVNLFHMLDLRPGEYNHRHYSLGWGHHHCNAVARDNGIEHTLDWMAEVLKRNSFTVSKAPKAEERIEAVKDVANHPEK